MAITDPILASFYHVPVYSKYQLFAYASFVIGVWMGRSLRATESIPRIAAFSLMNSMQFFILTNFGSWLWFNHYPRTMTGLADCYVAAIPFFGRTVASDLIFTAVLFGLHAWLTRLVAARERVAVTA